MFKQLRYKFYVAKKIKYDIDWQLTFLEKKC